MGHRNLAVKQTLNSQKLGAKLGAKPLNSDRFY